VIGVGDKIPWHHKGDLKRFFNLTAGKNLLMGYKTYLGLMNHYTKPGENVLPGRKIFVVAEVREQKKCSFEEADAALAAKLICEAMKLNTKLNNVIPIAKSGSSNFDLERIAAKLPSDNHLVIAGGANVYDEYLMHAESINLTIVDVKVDEPGAVTLSPTTFALLMEMSRKQVGKEVEDDVTARYYVLKD